MTYTYPAPLSFFKGEGVEGGDIPGGLDGGGVWLLQE